VTTASSSPASTGRIRAYSTPAGTRRSPAERYPRTEGVYAEWIAACKGGQPAGSNFVDHSGPLTEMVLLGNLAVRTARTLELDPSTGRITNANIPEDYVKPTYREGWNL
jgi:hypothetical protein